MAKKNTTTSPKSAKPAVSMFAASFASNKRASSNSFTEVNEYKLTRDEAKSIKDIRIVRATRTKDAEVLKARVTLTSGESVDYNLLHHWEFAVGDTIDKSTVTLCNLQDAEGNLKEYNGEPVVYLYGELD